MRIDKLDTPFTHRTLLVEVLLAFLVILISSCGNEPFYSTYTTNDISDGSQVISLDQGGYLLITTERMAENYENADAVLYRIKDNGEGVWHQAFALK